MRVDRKTRLCACALVVLAGAQAACGGSGKSGSTTSTSTGIARNATTALILGADGIGNVQTGEVQAVAVQTVTRYLGRPTKPAAAGPCNGTTEVEWSDLSLEFADGALDGYRYLIGGLSGAGELHPQSGRATPLLKTAAGATLGMTLAKVGTLYPRADFSEEQGGSIVVPGAEAGNRLFLGFFSSTSSTPLAEIKGGNTCGDV
ncbi:MAG: hypothetical protein ACLP6E_09060 [Acidimicrobiales bacterium]